MCYRCQVCREVVPHGVPRLLHVIYREVPYDRPAANSFGVADRLIDRPATRREITREIAVCSRCKDRLDAKPRNSLRNFVSVAPNKRRI